MKALFVGQPALGHLLPMVALADALMAAGDTVTFVTGADICADLARRGYDTSPAGISASGQRAFADAHRPVIRDPLDGMRFAHGTMFTRHNARLMLPDLLTVIHRVRPDVLVHESAEFATPLAGTLRGIPWVHHSYGIARPREIQQLATEAMAPLWHEQGVGMPPEAGMFAHAYLDVCPPTLQLAQPGPERRIPLRPADVRREATAGTSERCTVLVTFGTVFHHATTVIADLVREVARLPVDVLVTSGTDVSPTAFGQLPPNVRIEAFVPLADVLPRCAAVVTHGGSGTMLASLAHGVPLVLVPQGADQFLNATQVSASGAGVTAEGGSFARCLVDVLDTPTYAQAARALAAEIAAMPSATAVAQTLRGLTSRAGRST